MSWLAIALLWLAASAPDVRAQAPSDIVWCHDVARDIVASEARWRCTGRVVSEAEAKAIQDRRAARIRRSFEAPRDRKRGTGKRRATGTGFLVSDSGDVLTNMHVVSECRSIQVARTGGEYTAATLVAADAEHDLALLRAAEFHGRPAGFRPGPPPTAGTAVAVVGYPLHGWITIRPVLVRGTIAASRRVPDPAGFAMRIDVRRGNSGGPVLDGAGRVVGVVVAKVNSPDLYAATGVLVRDIGFGIESRVALAFLRRNGVNPSSAMAGAALDDSALLAAARRFVGQITCWQ